MEKRLIWLDDIRNPYEGSWIEQYSPIQPPFTIEWVKDYESFVDAISNKGLPDGICFDHDLGSVEETGYSCARWLVGYCLENQKDIPPYSIQSKNPVGKDNIDAVLKNYKKYYNYES